MKTLVIDTSTERGIAALFEHHQPLFITELPFGYNGSTYLVATIEQKMKELGLTPSHLSKIVVGVGPGSYTGIRVGAVVAKTIAFACQIPMIGISTLFGFSPKHEGVFAAIIDAKIAGFYVMKGRNNHGHIEYFSEPKVVSVEDIKTELDDVTSILSPNLERIKPLISSRCPSSHFQWLEQSPCAQAMHAFALESTPTHDLKLLYLRETQAEIEKRTQKARP